MSVFQVEETTIIPKRTIGPFTEFLTIEEIATDDLEITNHPVQQGATITDHAYLKPSSLSVRAMWDSVVAPLGETYQKLLKIQADREPFDVVTGKRIYKNMLLKGLAQTTDRGTEKILSVSFSLKQIVIVQVDVTSVPPRAVQADPATTAGTENAGQKNAQPATETRRKSILSLIGGLT